ncbi:glycosyl transferase, WecB/TagA/CpsF family [Xylanimonas cellulosilytica DSM 15894]|uniref:Glycosyl transferase, WecB/TagA/CpsF family n=1 Tax=Xylanimonas cellulosilytica (strain DSM 15894 / JCM 12276 / CECT 5975 / KCTC 9989 / LMG 20990 / NBRC 107835 / XIL07) TaxID=446471 RepID=D1BXR3_XYLCX|nr:WecB/TagA/CpsF family glycosyltransferase [Xylanimonas cellulosilytica]ACZ31704.1 glycosyl transferase, WecB/TagA/CpsF family [Xylanimonas cellulosilytica DSM 15894]
MTSVVDHITTRQVTASTAAPATASRILLGGVPVDLHDQGGALAAIRARSVATEGKPLGVVSVNLDHLHWFGHGTALNGNFGIHEGSAAPVGWLHLIDGAPIAEQARRATGRHWPRLAGSDLVGPILAAAEIDGVSVGFLGGAPSTQDELRTELAERYPNLQVAGMWAPSREELLDTDAADALAADIAAADVGILVVCLGKPRQELWIDHYGVASGARVLLAFGAVVDFLAGRVVRCPDWVAEHGLEWAWRLALEPKRLAHRYLVNGPGAYRMLRLSPAVVSSPPR